MLADSSRVAILIEESYHSFTMQFSLLIVAFAFLPLFYVIHLVYSSFTSPLRSVPGPFLARFTKLWYFWHVSQGHFEQVNLDLHRKYGKKYQTYQLRNAHYSRPYSPIWPE